MTRLAGAYAAVAGRLGRRGMLAVTTLSMVWGLVSGLTLTRDYAHSSALVGCLAGLVAVSAAFHLWGEYARRALARGAALTGVRGALLERPALVEGVTVSITQGCIQYIMMFCLPLLFFAHAWVTFGLACLVVLSSLVDRWWRRLSRRRWYTGLVRSFCAVVATSFAFAVFMPRDLRFFYPALGGVAVLGALPWGALVHRVRPRRADLAPVVLMVAAVAIEAMLNVWIRVPLLSVWLHRPALGLGLKDRELEEAWPPEVPRQRLAAALAAGREVCCLTPVVSPSGVRAGVTHEWLVDGRLIDRIQLPPVRGGDGAVPGAFRTFSCKKNLPPAASLHVLTCRVLLEDALYIGKAEVVFGGGA